MLASLGAQALQDKSEGCQRLLWLSRGGPAIIARAMRFRVQLDNFSGPLDLLLYLVRKHELDPLAIPIALVVEQYLEIVEVLQEIDLDAAADFLEMATRLMELKSRQMLPRPEETTIEEEVEAPTQDLVARLLEYKQFKEASARLEEQGLRWQRRYARRIPADEGDPLDPADQPLCEVELWDLVSALSRVLKRRKKAPPTKIRYDDTPIGVHMERLEARLQREQRLLFTDLFEVGMHRSHLAGLFLALLELIRHSRARVFQAELFGEIWVEAPESGEGAASASLPARRASEG
jgi:segregation and condensation protein A